MKLHGDTRRFQTLNHVQKHCFKSCRMNNDENFLRLSTELYLWASSTEAFFPCNPLQSKFAYWEQEAFPLKQKPKKLSLLCHVPADYFNCELRARSVFMPSSLFPCNLMRVMKDTSLEYMFKNKQGSASNATSYHHGIFINRQQQRSRSSSSIGKRWKKGKLSKYQILWFARALQPPLWPCARVTMFAMAKGRLTNK